MLKKTAILIALCLLQLAIKAQTVKRPLLLANSLSYKQNIYVYGYHENKGNLVFKCFNYSPTLQLTDSTELNLGKHSPSDYLEISVDTLHEFLNFYFQQANQKNTVTLLRTDEHLKTVAFTENFDANHINSISVFDDEKYVYKNQLYIIKINESDTGGNQFYLSKFQIQNIAKPFEYDYKWQFAFERKFIHRASIMYADSNYVMIYAHVFDGPKKGQWVLRLNANTGELIKGTKLNPKGDSRLFLASNWLYNKSTNSIDVIGSIYNADMIDFKKKTSNFVNLSKQHKLFLACIDSSGEVTTRSEKLFALPLQTNTGKHIMSYHVKIRSFKKVNPTDYSVWADLYELTNPNTLCYYSSWHIAIKPDDVDFAFVPSKFYVCSKVIPKLISFEKGDYYGKFNLDVITDYDKFKYKNSQNSIVIKTDYNNEQNPYYIIKKVNISNSSKQYNYVYMGKKGLENKVFLRSEQGQNMNLFFTDKKSYISFITNIGNSDFELKTNNL